jgi:hypothetical protein
MSSSSYSYSSSSSSSSSYSSNVVGDAGVCPLRKGDKKCYL